jgi:hypothetical protein
LALRWRSRHFAFRLSGSKLPALLLAADLHHHFIFNFHTISLKTIYSPGYTPIHAFLRLNTLLLKTNPILRPFSSPRKVGYRPAPECKFLAKNGLYLLRRTYQPYRSSPRDPRPTNHLIFANAHNTLELGPGISPWRNGIGNLEFECLRTVLVVILISSVCEVLSSVAFLNTTHVVSLVVNCPRLSVTVGKRILCRGRLLFRGLERIGLIGVS